MHGTTHTEKHVVFHEDCSVCRRIKRHKQAETDYLRVKELNKKLNADKTELVLEKYELLNVVQHLDELLSTVLREAGCGCEPITLGGFTCSAHETLRFYKRKLKKYYQS